MRFGASQPLAEAIRTATEKRTKEQTEAMKAALLFASNEYQAAKRTLAAAKKPLPADTQLMTLEQKLTETQAPITLDPKLVQLRRDAELSKGQMTNKRLTGAQDLAWALINSPAFLFNH